MSAIYTPKLATALARVAHRSIAARLSRAAAEEVSVAGSERVALNELALGARWEVVRQWGWRRAAHINLLEAGVLRAWSRYLVELGGDRHDFALLDAASRFARG